MIHRRLILTTVAVIVASAASISPAQVFDTTTNLVMNGNFEVGGVQGGQPVVPGWSQGPNPFETIAIGDDGSNGHQSVGFTTNVISDQNNPATWADWLSKPISVVAGEKLLLQFRYKMTSNAATPEGEVQVDSRGFAGVDGGGNPINYVGGGGFLLLTSTGGVWTSAEMQLLVPAGATKLDLRINQIFTNFTTLPWQGSFRMDDFKLYRELVLQADFDANNAVNSADLMIWKSGFPLSAGATKLSGDANGDGAVNGVDFLIWQRELGKGAMAAATVVLAPEPGCLPLCAAGGLVWARRRRRRLA